MEIETEAFLDSFLLSRKVLYIETVMPPEKHKPWGIGAVTRVLWTLFSCFVVESVVFGFSVLPAVLFWEWHLHWNLPGPSWIRTVLLSMAFIPAYLLFAVSLIVLSAVATRITGWRAPVDVEMPISRADWPLMNWGRYLISIHLVRIFAGPVFRATPLWAFYMRLNGARLGRRVFVNSLWVTDHNLLEFGNDVVIGSEAHLSGHTVERGVVKTAKVRLGDAVTVGVSSLVGIGVEAGPGCQIGALSVVPKFSKLEAGQTYAGVPVRRIEHHEKIETE
jgi:acetyltransferase-like isoleucine patch superfamily enzyme